MIGSALQRKKLRKRVGNQIHAAVATQHLSSFLSRPRGFIPTSSTMSDCGHRTRQEPRPIHRAPPSQCTLHLAPEQEGVRPYREKPSQRLTSVGGMVGRSKNSAPKRGSGGAVETGKQVARCRFRKQGGGYGCATTMAAATLGIVE